MSLSFNPTALKEHLKAKGFAVSEGDSWLATDQQQFADFCYFQFGLNRTKCLYALAYPTTLLPNKELYDAFVGITGAGQEQALTEPAPEPEVVAQTEGTDGADGTDEGDVIGTEAPETEVTEPVVTEAEAPAPEQAPVQEQAQPPVELGNNADGSVTTEADAPEGDAPEAPAGEAQGENTDVPEGDDQA